MLRLHGNDFGRLTRTNCLWSTVARVTCIVGGVSGKIAALSPAGYGSCSTGSTYSNDVSKRSVCTTSLLCWATSCRGSKTNPAHDSLTTLTNGSAGGDQPILRSDGHDERCLIPLPTPLCPTRLDIDATTQLSHCNDVSSCHRPPGLHVHPDFHLGARLLHFPPFRTWVSRVDRMPAVLHFPPCRTCVSCVFGSGLLPPCPPGSAGRIGTE